MALFSFALTRQASCMSLKKLFKLHLLRTQAPQIPTNCVLMVVALAVLQCMHEKYTRNDKIHLKEAFITCIRMFDGYDEARVPFDHYIEGSLKAKTRAKRATSAASYEVHDEMSITTISLKDLLYSCKTKSGLCELLAQALLKHFERSSKQVVVT